jgi:hypothetical protein
MITQTLLSNDQKKFIICTSFKNNQSIISPFTTEFDQYISDISFKFNTEHRVEKLKNQLYPLASTFKTDNQIFFDCVRHIDEQTDVFKNISGSVSDGIIHFDSVKKDNLIYINPKQIINTKPQKKLASFKFSMDEYKTDQLKIFSILLNKGFLLGIANNKYANIYFTTTHTENQIGYMYNCQYNISMVNNIQKLFPFIGMNKTSTKFIRLYITNKYVKNESQSLININRNFTSNTIQVYNLGKSIPF